MFLLLKSNKTLTPADKISNMYKLTKDEYNHLLDNAVTATYKKAMKGIKDIIDEEGIKFTKWADIFDTIEINNARNCFEINLERPQGKLCQPPHKINKSR